MAWIKTKLHYVVTTLARLLHSKWATMLRPIVGALIVLVVGIGFAYYLFRHPQLIQQLMATPRVTFASLLLLYFSWFGALVFTVYATLRLCGRPLPFLEHFLLNAYSTLVNFFVPGQGGLAMRGLYLKKRYALSLRIYVLASLVYYAYYAVLSALMMLATAVPVWVTIAGVSGVAGCSLFVLRTYARRTRDSEARLHLSASNLVMMGVATIVQAAVQILVYGIELRSVDPGIHWGQVVIYTGAGNFALFVALTPGGLGVRESFLLFSQHLHHVPTPAVVAASLMDRATFFVLLGLLFVFTLVFHAQRRLRVS